MGTYRNPHSCQSCCDTWDNSVVYDEWWCIGLRFLYTITTKEEKRERTKNKEEDDCQCYCACEGLTPNHLKDMHSIQLFVQRM